MKFECSKCSGRCKAEADFKPCKCLEDGSDSTYGWKEVTAPAPKPLSEAILPKLTVEVFDREDCPEWVNYLAVKKNGTATGFRDAPDVSSGWWACKTHFPIPYTIEKLGIFDPSDWQNSLIKRPEKKKLPDFIKVGAWVWNDEFGFGRVVNPHLLAVSIDWVKSGMRGGALPEQLALARVRPWTFEEAPMSVKVQKIKAPPGHQSAVLALAPDGFYYVGAFSSGRDSFEKIAKECVQLSGEPCGVLEVAEVGK